MQLLVGQNLQLDISWALTESKYWFDKKFLIVMYIPKSEASFSPEQSVMSKSIMAESLEKCISL